jgi:hypothetical protein
MKNRVLSATAREYAGIAKAKGPAGRAEGLEELTRGIFIQSQKSNNNNRFSLAKDTCLGRGWAPVLQR